MVRAAVLQVAAEDPRAGARPYYDAVLAEVALEQGDDTEAIDHARKALDGLQPGDALLRERVRAVFGRALSDPRAAAAVYEEVLATDPGLFRRLGWALPVEVRSTDAELDRELADAIRRSPRFEPADEGLVIQVESGRICLFGRTGAAWGCGEAGLEEDETGRSYAQRIVDAFHAEIFSPRIDLSRIDINSLDGSNRVTRNPLDMLLPQ